ncbi:hypothetical protein COP2_043400 [Malus domestica]
MVGQEESNVRSMEAELHVIREIPSRPLKSTLLDLTLIRVPRIPIPEPNDQINVIIRAIICGIIINSKEFIRSHIQLPLLNHPSHHFLPWQEIYKCTRLVPVAFVEIIGLTTQCRHHIPQT